MDRAQWEERGFFIVRGLLPPDTVSELRGVVRNTLLMPDPALAGVRVDYEPDQPAIDSVESYDGRVGLAPDATVILLTSPLHRH